MCVLAEVKLFTLSIQRIVDFEVNVYFLYQFTLPMALFFLHQVLSYLEIMNLVHILLKKNLFFFLLFFDQVKKKCVINRVDTWKLLMWNWLQVGRINIRYLSHLTWHLLFFFQSFVVIIWGEKNLKNFLFFSEET